jgi:integrase
VLVEATDGNRPGGQSLLGRGGPLVHYGARRFRWAADRAVPCVSRALGRRQAHNKYLLVMHAIFRRAQRRYGLTVNPVAGIERQPVRRSGDFRVLSGEEVAALARHAIQELDGAIFTTAAFSGLRLGELRALRWRDVDFPKRIIQVPRSYTMGLEDVPKSGKVRAVPMIDQVARVLDRLSRRSHLVGVNDLVFPGPTGDFFEDSALRRRYYRALKAAGIEHLRFHDLRHTFGTLAVQAFPLSDVKAYMGHADIATTMIYIHRVPQNDAADKLSRLLEAQTGATSPAALNKLLGGPPD